MIYQEKRSFNYTSNKYTGYHYYGLFHLGVTWVRKRGDQFDRMM